MDQEMEMMPTQSAVVAPKKLMTLDEYWDFVNRPENAGRLFELRKGEAIELSRPKKPHGIVTANISTELNLYARRMQKGYVLSNDTGVVLEETPGMVVGPDVAYCIDENTFDDVEPKWAESPPVLVVEVLSPTDKMSQVNEKIADYLKAGVKIVWLADPELKTLTVYRADRGHVVFKVGDDLNGGEALPNFACKVADFFRLPGEHAAPQPSSPTA